MNRTLLCIAHGNANDWEGICLDLDISVQGTSFEDVLQALEDSIAVYVEFAMEQEGAERDRLLSRKAPLTVRLSFLWQILKTTLSGRPDNGEQLSQFTLPAAA